MLAVKYTTLYQILCETEVHFSLVLLKIKLIIEIIYFKRIYLSANCMFLATLFLIEWKCIIILNVF